MNNSKVVYLLDRVYDTYHTIPFDEVETDSDTIRLVPGDALMDGITEHEHFGDEKCNK